jgi:1-deoxy-D-xylulose-5-phosphate synthase
LEFLSAEGLLDHGLKVRTMTLPDIFIDHDKPDVMYANAGLDAAAIVAKVASALGQTKATGGALRA